jgi:hypothetical protein
MVLPLALVLLPGAPVGATPEGANLATAHSGCKAPLVIAAMPCGVARGRQA